VDCEDEEAAFRASKEADILFMICVFHYIPQWKELLQRLMLESKPRLIYIARHYSPDEIDHSVFATPKKNIYLIRLCWRGGFALAAC